MVATGGISSSMYMCVERYNCQQVGESIGHRIAGLDDSIRREQDVCGSKRDLMSANGIPWEWLHFSSKFNSMCKYTYV